MRFVLDSSIAIKWVLPESDSVDAIQLKGEFQAGVHELLAPDILPVECGHALTRAERRRIIRVGDAELHLLHILSAGVPLHSHLPLLRRALTISSSTRVGVYDCVYVALAESENCQLVTGDTRLVVSLGTLFPFIVPLASLP